MGEDGNKELFQEKGGKGQSEFKSVMIWLEKVAVE